MEPSLPPELESSLEERIRAIGFDPAVLTPQEQQELWEIHSLCPDEALTV